MVSLGQAHQCRRVEGFRTRGSDQVKGGRRARRSCRKCVCVGDETVKMIMHSRVRLCALCSGQLRNLYTNKSGRSLSLVAPAATSCNSGRHAHHSRMPAHMLATVETGSRVRGRLTSLFLLPFCMWDRRPREGPYDALCVSCRPAAAVDHVEERCVLSRRTRWFMLVRACVCVCVGFFGFACFHV